MRTEENTLQRYRRLMSWQMKGASLSIKLGVKLIQRRSRLIRYYLRMGKYRLALRQAVSPGFSLPIYKHQQTDLTCLRMRFLNALSRWSSRLGTFLKERTITSKFNTLYTKCACMVQDARRVLPLNIKTFLSTLRYKLQMTWSQLSRILKRS